MQKDNIFLRQEFVEAILTKRCVKLRIGVVKAAKQIGLDPGTLSRIETGFGEISVISFFYICRWLKVDINSFFRKDTENLKALDKIISAVSLYYGVPPESFLRSQSNLNTESTHQRAILFFCIRSFYKMSYPNIRDKFSYKSHQPILRLVKIIDKKVKEKDPAVLLAIKKINEFIK